MDKDYLEKLIATKHLTRIAELEEYRANPDSITLQELEKLGFFTQIADKETIKAGKQIELPGEPTKFEKEQAEREAGEQEILKEIEAEEARKREEAERKKKEEREKKEKEIEEKERAFLEEEEARKKKEAETKKETKSEPKAEPAESETQSESTESKSAPAGPEGKLKQSKRK